MSQESDLLPLPAYQTFSDAIASLELPISISELHGRMCGYLSADAIKEGENYLQALMNNNKQEEARAAARAIFHVYTLSHQQINDFDFGFQLLLPEDHNGLAERAQAFSEWCAGFIHSMTCSNISSEDFKEEEAEQAFQHIQEFASLDYESIEVTDYDENAFMEVSEYARLAVLRLHGDLKMQKTPKKSNKSH